MPKHSTICCSGLSLSLSLSFESHSSICCNGWSLSFSFSIESHSSVRVNGLPLSLLPSHLALSETGSAGRWHSLSINWLLKLRLTSKHTRPENSASTESTIDICSCSDCFSSALKCKLSQNRERRLSTAHAKKQLSQYNTNMDLSASPTEKCQIIIVWIYNLYVIYLRTYMHTYIDYVYTYIYIFIYIHTYMYIY